jgi:hypothetical protein
VAKKSWTYEVSGNYFDMLGVQPQQGRFFHANDEHGPNSAPYIVLSDAFWRSRFGADPRIVGSIVELNKHPFTIIGVAPAEFPWNRALHVAGFLCADGERGADRGLQLS